MRIEKQALIFFCVAGISWLLDDLLYKFLLSISTVPEGVTNSAIYELSGIFRNFLFWTLPPLFIGWLNPIRPLKVTILFGLPFALLAYGASIYKTLQPTYVPDVWTLIVLIKMSFSLLLFVFTSLAASSLKRDYKPLTTQSSGTSV